MTLLIHKFIFWLGYQLFKITGRTPVYPYYSFRKLFVLTRGKLNDQLSENIKKETGAYNFASTSGVLGNLDEMDIQKIVSEIAENGYYIFQKKLKQETIAKLREMAYSLEAELIPAAANERKKAKYEPNKPLAPKYQFDESSLMANDTILELASDYSLLAIAQAYLGTKPIQDLTAMWWSTAFSKQASSESAQLYHFDMDRIKFLKFFFYLTDVDTSTGPHCYIRGTNQKMPAKLWKDGRILDGEIESAIRKEDLVEIVGTSGTIIAVDTRGLHKGKPLEHGERLILQFEFTNSLFGAPYNTINLQKDIDKKYFDMFRKFPHTFQRFRF